MITIVNILFDTTYILPLFGIDVSIPRSNITALDFRNQISTILTHGFKKNKLLITSTSLIEVMYLLNREYRHSQNPEILDRFVIVIPTLLRNDNLTLIEPMYSPEIMRMGNQIRYKGHPDLFDTWIAATARFHDAIFITEDQELLKILPQIGEFESMAIWNWHKLWDELGK